MSPEPPPQLSPELVLVLPPEVAAIARMAIREPGFPSPAPGAGRSVSPAAVAALYAGVLILTLTPLALVVKGLPTHRPAPSPPAAHNR